MQKELEQVASYATQIMKNKYMLTQNKLSLLKSIALVTLLGAFITSCKKENSGGPQDPPNPPVIPPAPTVLLKEINIPNLPSPYYHFEYDAAAKPKFVSFASDLTRYDIVYDNTGRLLELRNNIIVNKDTIRYFYDNEGRAVAINYIDMTGKVYVKLALTYEGKKLVFLERQRLAGSDFLINKTLTFAYYADGNLKELVDHRPAVNGQTESTSILRFEQYDDKTNVDAFELLHNDFFDHLVLLPGVQLQKNNPIKENSTGFNSYSVEYTYTYNEKNEPLTKKGNVLFIGGPLTGQSYKTNESYTYY